MVTVESAGISDVGKKRSSNEDRIFIDDNQGLYLVADGMGGHQAGEVASTLVVETMREFLGRSESFDADAPSRGNLSARAHRLIEGIEWSNRVVHQTSTEDDRYRGMGSTLAAVYFAEDTLIAANVGDSPIYLVRNDAVSLLSVPHTLQADLPPDAQVAFLGNILTRAMGPKDTVEADICELNCFKGDQVVICSDGLSTKVTPNEISAITAAHPPADSCRALVQLANDRGGEDNISAVVLRVTDVRRKHCSGIGKWLDGIRQRITSKGI
jgi:PPM family protein phosphatase